MTDTPIIMSRSISSIRHFRTAFQNQHYIIHHILFRISLYFHCQKSLTSLNNGKGTFRSVYLNAIYMKRIFRPAHMVYNFTFPDCPFLFQIIIDGRMNRPLINHGTIFQAYSFGAQASHRRHIMTHKQYCPSLSFRHVLHLANGLLLELRIPHR